MIDMSETTNLMPLIDAVREFRISRPTLQQWIRDGRIHEYRREIGKTRVFVDRRELEQLLVPRTKDEGSEA